MTVRNPGLLFTSNGGFSGNRVTLFGTGEPPARLASGKIERIVLPPKSHPIVAPDHGSCVALIME